MAYNIMVTATALPSVVGRVDYVTSPDRQEHLEAVYRTADADPEFWKSLSEHCQEQAKYSQSKKACEGREFMFMFANDLYQLIDPEVLAKMVSDKLHEMTGTENVVGVHWNKKKNNYHCHAVVSENIEVNEVEYGAVLTRNTYFDADGRRSTKKACTDENGVLKKGCEFIPKGGRKETVKRFGAKVQNIGSKGFLLDVKSMAVQLQNELLKEDRFRVYTDDGIHLPKQHVGKDKPKEIRDAIELKNQRIDIYNVAVDDLLGYAAKVSPEQIEEEKDFVRELRQELKEQPVQNWSDWILQMALRLKQRTKELIRQLNPFKNIESVRDRLAVAKEQKDPRPGIDALIKRGIDHGGSMPGRSNTREYER